MRIVVALIAVAALLSGCGKSEYCKSLESYGEEVKLASGKAGVDAFADIQKAAEDAAAAAPKDIADDWKIVIKAIDELLSTIKDTGLSLDEINAAIQSQDTSKLSDEQRVRLTEAYTKLNSKEIKDADSTIAKHAKAECEIDLSK